MFKKFLYYFFNFKKIISENNLLRKKIDNYQNDISAAYNDGCIDTWSLIQVALYDMYMDMDILDYSSLIESISNKLILYDNDDNLKQLKINEFIKQMSISTQIMRGGDAYYN